MKKTTKREHKKINKVTKHEHTITHSNIENDHEDCTLIIYIFF